MEAAITAVKEPKAVKAPKKKKTKAPNEIIVSLESALKDYKPKASKKKIRKALSKTSKLFSTPKKAKTAK